MTYHLSYRHHDPVAEAKVRSWMLKRVQHDVLEERMVCVQRDNGGNQFATSHRHPELVSGSMAQWFGQSPRHGQVIPIRIALFDEVYLPLPMPSLELLFPRDGAVHVVEEFGMDETMDPVTRSKATRRDVVPVLPHARGQVGRNADVERPPFAAGENICARQAIPHDAQDVAQWMLKQVQHDVVGQ